MPPKIGLHTSLSAHPKEKEREREEEDQDQGVILGTFVEYGFFLVKDIVTVC